MRLLPLRPSVLLAILVVFVASVAAALAVTEKPAVVLEPGVAWRVYDSSGGVVSGLVVDDVIKGLDVIVWRVDSPGGGVGRFQTGSSGEATKAIEAEFGKGATVARGHFLDRGHLNFTATRTFETGLKVEAKENAGNKKPGAGAAGAPGAGGKGEEAAGAPGAGGPKGKAPGGKRGGAKAGASGAGSGESGGGDEGEKKGLPILPIGIGAVVVVAGLVLVMKRKK